MSLGTHDPGPFRHWPAIDFPSGEFKLRIFNSSGALGTKWNYLFVVEDLEGNTADPEDVLDEDVQKLWVDDVNGATLDLRSIPVGTSTPTVNCDTAEGMRDIGGNLLVTADRPFDGYHIERAATLIRPRRTAVNDTETNPSPPFDCLLNSEEPTSDPGYTDNGTMS